MPITFIGQRPPADIFEKYSLDSKHQDDCLIASIIYFRQLQPGTRLTLITDDMLAMTRSGTFDIDTYQLGEELRLQDTPDEQVKLIENLKRENQTLRDRIPKVNLFFDNHEQRITIEVKTTIRTREEFVKDKVAKIQHEILPIPLIEQKENMTLSERLTMISAIGFGNARREKYNKDLEDYFKEYERFAEKYYTYGTKIYKTITLRFLIFNEGTSPAEDIDIWMHLPDGFTVSKKQAEEPKPPKPPFRPQHDYDSEPFDFNLTSPNFDPRSAPLINFDAPTVIKTNSYEVVYHTTKLKHDLGHTFDPIYLSYEEFEKMENFNVDYKLRIANVPSPVTGQLHVRIDRGSNDL